MDSCSCRFFLVSDDICYLIFYTRMCCNLDFLDTESDIPLHCWPRTPGNLDLCHRHPCLLRNILLRLRGMIENNWNINCLVTNPSSLDFGNLVDATIWAFIFFRPWCYAVFGVGGKEGPALYGTLNAPDQNTISIQRHI